MSITVFAFDPGITTGFAAIDSEIGILQLSDIPANDILSGCFSMSLPIIDSGEVYLAIEQTPIPTLSKMNRKLQLVESALFRFVQDSHRPYVYIAPGLWKNTQFGKLKISEAGSPHQRDAACLAMFYLHLLQKGAHHEVISQVNVSATLVPQPSRKEDNT